MNELSECFGQDNKTMLSGLTRSAKHSRLFMYGILTLLYLVITFLPAAAGPPPSSKLFQNPKKCKTCHYKIYTQWKGSMHSRSYLDPVWRAATKRFVTQAKKAGKIKDLSFCLRCHVPSAFVSARKTKGDLDKAEIKKLSESGVHCDFCHSLKHTIHTGKPNFVMVFDHQITGEKHPPGTRLGPLKDPETTSTQHNAVYAGHFTRSEFCGSCHDVFHFENKLPIISTYTEWKNSPYNTGDPATTVTCQDCHMRQRPGVPATGSTPRPDNPGQAAESGPKRKHVPTHYFVGGNSMVAGIEQASMAVERLQNAAELEIQTDRELKRGELGGIRVKITNSGSGHMLPTGMPGFVQVWLEIKVSGADGKNILSSGVMDIRGNLPEDTHIFRKILGDKDGKPSINLILADRILYDNRIPPTGYVLDKYYFLLPPNLTGDKIKVSAKLKYRAISQRLMNDLLGGLAQKVPVVTMEAVEKEISIK